MFHSFPWSCRMDTWEVNLFATVCSILLLFRPDKSYVRSSSSSNSSGALMRTLHQALDQTRIAGGPATHHPYLSFSKTKSKPWSRVHFYLCPTVNLAGLKDSSSANGDLEADNARDYDKTDDAVECLSLS